MICVRFGFQFSDRFHFVRTDYKILDRLFPKNKIDNTEHHSQPSPSTINKMKLESRPNQRNLRTRGLLLLTLIFSSSAFTNKKISHGIRKRHTPKARACLYGLRRPQRPESTEKKRAERKAIIETRQNDALQDPTLLTNISFVECTQLHPNSKRAIIENFGHQTMTEVQAKTFSAALSGKDILARARTGTGKTCFMRALFNAFCCSPLLT